MADQVEEKKRFTDDTAIEVARLNGQHEVWKRAFNGRQIFAPVDLSSLSVSRNSSNSEIRILDSACANGLWLLDLRESLLLRSSGRDGNSQRPAIRYFGCDIDSAKFPATTFPDVEFHAQSFTDPWPAAWAGTFDFVHQRLALAAGGKTPLATTMAGFVGLLKPGRGWLQIVEFDTSPPSSAEEQEGEAWSRFRRLLAGVGVAKGVIEHFATRVKGVMEGVGLVDVQEQIIRVPHGRAIVGDEKMVVQSIDGPCGIAARFVKMAKGLEIGLSEEEIHDVVPDLEKELLEHGALLRVRIIWGRRKEMPAEV